MIICDFCKKTESKKRLCVGGALEPHGTTVNFRVKRRDVCDACALIFEGSGPTDYDAIPRLLFSLLGVSE